MEAIMRKTGVMIALLVIVSAAFLSSCQNPVNSTTVNVTGVSLNSPITLLVGESEKLTETLSPSDATDTGVSWKSTDPSIAEVDNHGTVTGKAVGQTVITVTTDDGDFVATCDVLVAAFRVESITLNKTTLTMSLDEIAHLEATVTPACATNQNVTWSSSDNDTVVIVPNVAGTIFAKAAGTAIITATTEDGNKTATCTVTVEE